MKSVTLHGYGDAGRAVGARALAVCLSVTVSGAINLEQSK